MVHSDERALLTLYDRYSSRVYTVALRILNDPMQAEEVLQDTFLKLWSRARQYLAERGPFLIWLLTIARHTALDRLRVESRQPALYDADDPDLVWQSIPEPNSTSDEARWHSLHMAVRALPDGQRTVIEMAYYQGLSQSEIAEVLNLPLGTVKTRLRDGMERLRREWLRDGEA